MNNPFSENPYSGVVQPSAGSFLSRGLYFVLGAFVLIVVGYVLYRLFVSKESLPAISFGTAAKDQTPTPVDGTKGTTISAVSIPMGDTTDYGIQYWMYIKDWNYGFGREKGVLLRADPNNKSIMNPNITLHPTDNSLNVSVNVYPTGTTAGASTPAASNETNATGDVFTCTVENVPLQAWFSVSVTVFQRNLDVYINGRLVKSCILPGIPKVASGDIVVGANNGFSGSVCNVHHYPRMLTPADAMTFFSAGTSCGTPVTTTTDTGSSFTLFGYRFTFSVKDKTGQEVRNYSF